MTQRRLPAGFNTADENDIIQKGADNLWYSRGPGEIILPGRFLRRRVFTIPGSLLESLLAQTTTFRVFGQGPGGGGGGVDGDGPGTAGVGASGQAGGYFDHIFTVSPGILTFTRRVGSGGAGGDGTGATSGAAGSASTRVIYNGVTVGGMPGAGGLGMTAIAVAPAFIIPATGGTIEGTPDIALGPTDGEAGVIMATGVARSGRGGSSVLARGGAPSIWGNTPNGNGASGRYGGGGSGAVTASSTLEPDGGAGGDGILVVDEYS